MQLRSILICQISITYLSLLLILFSPTVTRSQQFYFSNSYHYLLFFFLIVQLQVKLSSKERRITGLKEEVNNLKLRLNEEEQRVTSLRSQRVAVEEELETVMEVITHLNPHSERSVLQKCWN